MIIRKKKPDIHMRPVLATAAGLAAVLVNAIKMENIT